MTSRFTASTAWKLPSKRLQRLGVKTSTKHWEKADVARELHKNHGLPDVVQLLRDLNDARKSAAYGDVPAPSLNAEDVASEIEAYVDAVGVLVEGTAAK
jgi:hypothetical protein